MNGFEINLDVWQQLDRLSVLALLQRCDFFIKDFETGFEFRLPLRRDFDAQLGNSADVRGNIVLRAVGECESSEQQDRCCKKAIKHGVIKGQRKLPGTYVMIIAFRRLGGSCLKADRWANPA